MMPSGHLRILPLLVFVAFLAFSVRFADVVHDVWGGSGAAFAAKSEEKHDAPEAKEHSEDEDKKSESHAEGEEEAGPPLIISDEDSEESVDWQDAGDSDLSYSSVRMELFDDLSERRQELEDREKKLMTREALLKAAEQELDRKFQELSQLRSEIERLLEQQSDEEKARIQSLVKIYEGMKPKDAARIFDTLDLDILVAVVSTMSERRLSPILAAMNPERARTVTIMLAEQKKLPTLPGN